MSQFKTRVKNEKRKKKKGHQRRGTNKSKRGGLYSWDIFKREERNGKSN